MARIYQCDGCKGYDPGTVFDVIRVELRIWPKNNGGQSMLWAGDLCHDCRADAFVNVHGLREMNDGNASS